MAATETIRAIEFGLLGWIAAHMLNLRARFEEWKVRRATRIELNALSDAELDDIGLLRHQLRDF